MRSGPCAKFAFDPAVIASYLDHEARYVTEGSPPRRRHVLKGKPIHPHDARIIRRWRSGTIDGATKDAVLSMFHHYGLTLDGLNEWAARRNLQPILRGQLSFPIIPTQESSR